MVVRAPSGLSSRGPPGYALLTVDRVPYQSRWRLLWEALRDDGLSAMVIHGRGQVAHFGNIAYLTGHVPSNKGLFAVIAPGRAPEIIVSSAQAARFVLKDPSLAPGVVVRTAGIGPEARLYESIAAAAGEGRIGLAATDDLGLPAKVRDRIASALGPGADVVDATGRLETLRRLPESAKVAQMRLSMGRAEGAMEAASRRMQTGCTESEVAAAVVEYLRSSGSVFDIVHVAANDFIGQHPGTRNIVDGDIVTVFVETASVDGYWVELGALFAVGDVSAQRVRLAEKALKVLKNAASYLHSGQKASVVAAFVAGQGRQTIGIGHCTGLDEIPLPLTPEATWTLMDGEAIALHPSLLSEDGQQAIGLANTYIVSDKGGLPLSQYPKKLRRISRSNQ